MANPNALVEQQLVAATQIIEKQLDAEIERLDNLDSEDLDSIRRDRLAAMKKRQQKKQDWIANVRNFVLYLFQLFIIACVIDS